MSRREHLSLVLCLIVSGVGLHWSVMFETSALIDEGFYESGFAALAAGGSSYDAEGFMYPPSFAAGGVWLQEILGVERLRQAVRWLNFACLVFLLWFSVYWYSSISESGDSTGGGPAAYRPHGWWLPGLAIALMAIPGVKLGLLVGNISFLIGALIVAGFWVAGRTPAVAGALLGVSLLIKPLVAGSLPLLLLSPRARRLIHPRRWATAAIAGFGSLLVLWFLRDELPRMLNTEMTSMAQDRSLSLYRISRVLGFGELRLPIFGVITAALCVVLWGRLRSRNHLLAAALAMVPLTTLAVWSHTRVLFLPVVAIALRRLVDRRCGATAHPQFKARFKLPSDPSERLEVVCVLGAAAVVLFFHSGGFSQIHPAQQIALLLPPMLAPLGLLGYWLATQPLTSSRSSGS